LPAGCRQHGDGIDVLRTPGCSVLPFMSLLPSQHSVSDYPLVMMEIVPNRPVSVAFKSSKRLSNSSFTNGIQFRTRITTLFVLCCSIGICQGRQNALPRGRASAFVHQRSLSSSSKTVRATPVFAQILSEATAPSIARARKHQPLFMSSEMRDEVDDSLSRAPTGDEDLAPTTVGKHGDESDESVLSKFLSFLRINEDEYKKPPPFQVEDTSLLFYDVFLILNLSLSISFWAVHRMSFDYIGSAVSEGSSKGWCCWRAAHSARDCLWVAAHELLESSPFKLHSTSVTKCGAVKSVWCEMGGALSKSIITSLARAPNRSGPNGGTDCIECVRSKRTILF
jgi:hypothetical protein